MLWHYTSMKVLNEFLKPDAKLYASHFAYVNDTQDCRVATRVLATVMAARVQWWRGAMEIPDLRSLIREIERGAFMPRFIACFSRQEDDLSQWRGYAAERGVSIGFDETSLKALIGCFVHYPARIAIKDCIYRTQQELDQEVLESNRETEAVLVKEIGATDLLYEIMPDGKTEVKSSEEKQRIADMVSQFKQEYATSLRKSEESIFWKHDAFKAENEVRLAVTFDGPLPTRNIELIGGIPRVAVPLKKSLNTAIRKVVIGPSIDADCDMLTTRTLAYKYHLPISVCKSRIPYRSRIR